MRSHRLLAFCTLALCLHPAFAQTGPQPPSSAAPASPAGPATAAAPAAPAGPMTATRSQPISPIGDPAAYVASHFGTSFKVDRTLGPLFGDLDGDGNEDAVFVATSAKPLADREQFEYKVEDPYDAYFGTGDVSITSQFNLHFDGSGRDLLIVFNWRAPHPPRKQHVAKYVLINTPFETTSITGFWMKKKKREAIETVDRQKLHSLVFWTGKKWRWSAQGMSEDEILANPLD